MKQFFTVASLLAIVFFSQNINAQVGVGTDEPHASAMLEIKSTTQGFLLPRLTESEMNTLEPTAAEGLMVYCSDCTPKCMYVKNDTEFVTSCASDAVALPFSVITGPTGKKWADRDLGATAAPTSYTDTNPAIQGNLYQWGRTSDGHEDRNSAINNPGGFGTQVAAGTEGSTFISVDYNVSLDWLTVADDQRWNSGSNGTPAKTTNDPCPDGYRVPTQDELTAEYDALALALGQNPTATDMFDALKWNANDSRDGETGVIAATNGTHLWTSTARPNEKTRTSIFISSTGNFESTASRPRANANSVRCIEE